MTVDGDARARERLRDIQERLRPDAVRTQALEELNELFRSGRAPEPLPSGMLNGGFLTTSISGPLDALGRRVARAWMPWLGKTFDPEAMTGVNLLTKNARGALRMAWPGYVPERELADRIEAFPFRNRVAPGEVDPDLDVLKIDYDIEANPALVRRILDELVQLDDDLYLGKVLFRRQGAWVPIGFFTLGR